MKTLHETWTLMRDLSAAEAGIEENVPAAEEHKEWLTSLNEEEQAQFSEQAGTIVDILNAVKDFAETVSNKIMAELGISKNTAEWTAADLHAYLGRVQTTGEYAELLSLAPLVVGDPRVLFDLGEPAEEEVATNDGD